MKRAVRIALEILAPPLIGSILYYLVMAVAFLWEAIVASKMPTLDQSVLQLAGAILLYAYIFAGIPSILHMALMEVLFTRGLDPKSWRAVRISTVSGAACGIVIAALLGGLGNSPISLPFFGGIGIAVGFLLGLLVKRWPA